jgi:hypothetical protein
LFSLNIPINPSGIPKKVLNIFEHRWLGKDFQGAGRSIEKNDIYKKGF